MTARTVADVVLGEATSGTRAQRYEDMRAIASVIENRARQLGVSPQEVVANRREFNAYGKALPKGVNAYRDLAEQALTDVRVNGPVHGATFYATPSAVKNLPKGLSKVTATKGHNYYSDPQNRAIGTSKGYRQPNPSRAPTPQTATAYAGAAAPTGASRAIQTGLLAGNVPTPTARPTNQTYEVQTKPVSLMGSTMPAPDTNRFGYRAPMSMPKEMANKIAASTGLLAGRVAPQGVPQAFGLTPAQETNLASRLGAYDTVQPSMAQYGKPPTTAVASRQAPSVPTPTARPTAPALSPAQTANLADRLGTFAPTQPAASLRTAAPATRPSLGGLLGVSPAAAATLPASGLLSTTTNFAGAAGSPRALEGRLQQSSLLAPARVPTPTFADRPAPITTTRNVGPAPTVAASRPTTRATPVAAARVQQAPASSAAPSQPQQPTRNYGRIAGAGLGAVAGTAIGGPVGGVLGIAAANKINGQPMFSNPFAPSTPTVDEIDDPTKKEKIDPKSFQQKALTVGTALLGSAVAGPVGGLIGGYVGKQLTDRGLLGSTRAPTLNSQGYASTLPSRPAAPSKAQRAALDRDLAVTGRMGNGGPSISKEASRAIGAEKAAGKGPGGLW